MSSSSENESTAVEQPNYITEATLENLKTLREQMLQNHKDFNQKSKEFEMADANKYLMLSNIKETIVFENDSEDMGVTEDLVFLNIKI